MGKSFHDPNGRARKDHCGLIRGNWFTSVFASVIIRFVVLLRLTNRRNKKDSIRVLLNIINRNNEQHYTREYETKTKKENHVCEKVNKTKRRDAQHISSLALPDDRHVYRQLPHTLYTLCAPWETTVNFEGYNCKYVCDLTLVPYLKLSFTAWK